MLKINEIKKSWLAGFIDGEGYIGITFQFKKSTKTSEASPRYHPYLIITSTNLGVLVYIKKIIGERKLYNINKNKNVKHKEAFQYKLSKMNVLLEILNCIIPYLKIKQVQCKILIDYITRRMQIKPITGRGTRGVSSFNENDEKLYQQLLTLNKRGIL